MAAGTAPRWPGTGAAQRGDDVEPGFGFVSAASVTRQPPGLQRTEPSCKPAAFARDKLWSAATDLLQQCQFLHSSHLETRI